LRNQQRVKQPNEKPLPNQENMARAASQASDDPPTPEPNPDIPEPVIFNKGPRLRPRIKGTGKPDL
jgi:hypothetical protein